MNEVEINQKLDVVVKLAQSRILTFLGDFTKYSTPSKYLSLTLLNQLSNFLIFSLFVHPFLNL